MLDATDGLAYTFPGTSEGLDALNMVADATRNRNERNAMPRLTAAVTVLLAASISFGADVEGFHNSLKAARTEAKQAGKPMYIHFTTTWCGWCRRIENDTYKSEQGKKALKDFVAVSLDCTVPRGERPTGEKKQYIDLMRKLGGRGYPFLAILGADGTVYDTQSGYLPPEPFAVMLQDATDSAKELAEFRKNADSADGNSVEHHVEAMYVYAPLMSIDEDKAREYRELAAQHALTVLQWKKDHPDADVKPASKAKAASVLLSEHRQEKLVAPLQGKVPSQEDLLKIVLENDPKNEELLLELAYFPQAMYGLEQIGRSSSDSEKNQALARAETLLDTLTANAKELEAGQRIWFVLGKVREMQGKTDQAVAAFNKAVEADPDSPGALQIKRMIEGMK